MQGIKSFFITWLILLILNQILLFHGCFAIYCLIAGLLHTGIIAFILVRVGRKKNTPAESELKVQIPKVEPRAYKKPAPPKIKTKKSAEILFKPSLFRDDLQEYKKQVPLSKAKHTKPEPEVKAVDPLKQKGDQYERYIGQQFAAKGDLVIYNGFINGYADQGVDIISISSETKVINLVQCKNWTKMRMTLAYMNDIYSKLEQYDFDCFQLASYEIEEYTQHPDIYLTLHHAKDNFTKYTVRKTLYIASEKVVDLEIGPYLTMMSDTIFKFKDMKIVMKKSA